MWFVLLFFCVPLINGSSLQDKEYLLREKIDLEVDEAKGYAQIKLHQAKVARGTPYTLELEYHNTGEGRLFYNVFFNREVPLPGQLAIFDSEKKYQGNLFYSPTDTRKRIGTSDWTFIPRRGYVGIKLSLVGANAFRSKIGGPASLLPPGTYYIQMIFYKAFVGLNLFGNKIEKGINQQELFRSNLVEVMFVDI